MTNHRKTLIAFSTTWGSRFGGINSFNRDLLSAFAGVSFSNARAICIVLSATKDETALAEGDEVQLINLNCREQKFGKILEPKVWEMIIASDVQFDPTETVWLGHDRITGEIAIEAAQKRGGRSALINHMSYGSYESFAENSNLARSKDQEQLYLFSNADIVLAVGPLLRDTLSDMLDREDIRMLIPGIPDITVKKSSKKFKAFLSGRLSDDAKKIKQAHLGIAAFADAIRQADCNAALPDPLRGENEPKLTLRGVDLEESNSNGIFDAELAIKIFAESHAGRAFDLNTLPFTTDRTELFSDLAGASLSMMPSWHEGFGLVAWETIGAGVPLIISKKSGVFRLLTELEDGLYVPLVTPIDVAGSSEAPFFLNKDKVNLSQAIIQIAKDTKGYKQKATRLREELSRLFSWAECARQLLEALDWNTENEEDSQIAQPDVISPNPPITIPINVEILELPNSNWKLDAGFSDSQLLRAEEAIIPFDSNREPFLADQIHWATEKNYPICVRLLTGPGGIGKTRLALELCERLRQKQWKSGFLRGDADSGQVENLAKRISKSQDSFLVVLDYAETRQQILLTFLKFLLAGNILGQVRILLLARQGGEWWSLLPSRDTACESLLEGMASTGPFLVPELHNTAFDRRTAYKTALNTFAARLNVPAPLHSPNFGESHFGHPLYIQMAALMALRGERPRSAEALTRTLVSHERRYWRKALVGVSSQIDVVEQQAALLMALATLINGAPTVKAVEKIWAEAGGEPSLLKPLFKALVPLYPGRQGIDGWRPDLLGEALISQVVLTEDGNTLLSAIFGQSNQRVRQSALTVIARLLRNRSDLSPIIEDAIVPHFVKSIDELVAGCIGAPQTLSKIVERAFVRLDKQEQGQAAGILSRHLKFDIVPLAGLYVLVSRLHVEKAQLALDRKQSIDTRKNLAQELENFSISLVRDGQNDLALDVIEKALNIRRKLASLPSFQMAPELAAALDRYAMLLSEKGRTELALNTARQALQIHRRNSDLEPKKFEKMLARSLSNCSTLLAAEGQHEDAFQYAKEALELRIKLARIDPLKNESEVAISLINYGNRSADQGKSDDALKAAEQAVRIHTRLADERPEQNENGLGVALNNYAGFLASNGQFEEAIAAAEKSLEIRRKLAHAKPERFEDDLALTISNYAIHLSEQGRFEEATIADEEALIMRRRMVEENSHRFEPDLAQALGNHAAHLAEIGRFDLAVQAEKEANAILARLATRTPKRYLFDHEHSTISLQFWSWLADESFEWNFAENFVPELLSAREKLELTYNYWVMRSLVTRTKNDLKHTFESWIVLDRAQQHSWMGSFIAAAELAERTIGADFAPARWRDQLEIFRRRLRGNFPRWMEVIAGRGLTKTVNEMLFSGGNGIQ